MTQEFKGTPFRKTPGAAIGLGVGAVIGLLAIPFVGAKVPVEGLAMLLGALIGLAADRKFSRRERLIGGIGALAVSASALAVVLSR